MSSRLVGSVTQREIVRRADEFAPAHSYYPINIVFWLKHDLYYPIKDLFATVRDLTVQLGSVWGTQSYYPIRERLNPTTPFEKSQASVQTLRAELRLYI